MKRSHFLVWCAGLAWLFLAAPARAEESYYFALFTCQTDNDRMNTFAVFIKATGDTPRSAKLESHTVSCATGANRELADLLRSAKLQQARITMWGPYPVKKELFDAAGKTGPNLVEEIAQEGELLRNRGDAFCLLVVRRLAPWFTTPGRAPDWIQDRLELDKYGVRPAAHN